MKQRLLKLLEVLRERQHPQSQWLLDQEQGRVNFLENLYFTYGLFLTKQADQIKEAKDLLYRLLSYEILPKGTYPSYLTDFPLSNDQLIALKALEVYLKIYEGFKDILGKELKELLLEKMDRAYSGAHKFYHQNTLRGRSLLLTLVVMYRYEELFHIEVKLAEKALASLCITFDELPKNREAIAELFAICGELPKDMLKDLRRDVSAYFAQAAHSHLGFIGPLHDERFENGKLTSSFFETLTGFHHSSAKALVYYPKAWDHEKVSGSSFKGYQSEKQAYAYFNQVVSTGDVASSRSYPLFYTWNHEGDCHSLVLKSPKANVTIHEKSEGVLIADFTFKEPLEFGKTHKSEEILLYISRLPGMHVSMSDVKATCFPLDQEVKIEMDRRSIALKFTLVDGDGDWMGHVAMGDRAYPAGLPDLQTIPDWKIFLRTIRRSDQASMRLVLKISLS